MNISFDILNNSANFTLELIDGNIELSTDVMDDDSIEYFYKIENIAYTFADLLQK